jgi:AbrB family looped-hinge helix DNA binding protein
MTGAAREWIGSIAMAIEVKIDARGRLTIPHTIRKQLGIEPGDAFVVDAEAGVLRYIKVENRFGLLAIDAINQYRAGQTKSLRDFARENGISLDTE